MAGNRRYAGGVASAVKNFHRIQDDAAIEEALAALARPAIGWSLNTLLSAVERAQTILSERIQRRTAAGVLGRDNDTFPPKDVDGGKDQPRSSGKEGE